jgi:hypothetical protein
MYNEHLKICEIEYTQPKVGQAIMYQAPKEQGAGLPVLTPMNFLVLNAPLAIVILFTMLAKLLSKPASKIDHFTIQTDVRINQLRMRIETLEQRTKSDPLNLKAKIDRLEGILRSLETPAPYKIDQDGEK